MHLNHKHGMTMPPLQFNGDHKWLNKNAEASAKAGAMQLKRNVNLGGDMTHTDYCFMMLAIFVSPMLYSQWRVILDLAWFIL